uniref:tryptophan synthase n=1 Tax=uncultured prokaryote TaxID=198431 RepID=H5SPX5_9ZZZZ|nr:tryptophan synthase alpha chain [uncultured prokaryote]
MGRDLLYKKFSEAQRGKKKILAVYITAGFPSLNDTVCIVKELAKNGVDIVELGMPFSDPIADGPVIQKTSTRALESGVKLKDLMKMCSEVKNEVNVPLLLMSYFNPILKYGIENLFRDAGNAGIDGFIIPDLPPEEGKEFYRMCKKLNFATVLFLSPLTPPSRINLVDKLTTGFIYYISITGITGSRINDLIEVVKKVKLIKEKVHHPVLVGFGISSADEARNICSASDGIIVGSAFLRKVEEEGAERAVRWIKELAGSLQ